MGIFDVSIWQTNIISHPKSSYTCGFCGSLNNGLYEHQCIFDKTTGYYGSIAACVKICLACNSPTIVFDEGTIPSTCSIAGLKHLPEDIENIFEEARSTFKNREYTSTIMLCRKLLMHIGVEKGAEEGKFFEYYVDYLVEKLHIPEKWAEMVHSVRKAGNHQNHKLILGDIHTAQTRLTFTRNVLFLLYESVGDFDSQNANVKN